MNAMPPLHWRPVASSSEPLPGIRVIDTKMGGWDGLTSAYLVTAEQPALVETGPTTSLEPVAAALEGLGLSGEELAHIAVTHVHLDHAGGVGAYARRFPRATIWVHERGAAHVVDPTKLVASATRVFGQDHMDRVFGPMDPVPADRVRGVVDGQVIDLGDRRLEIMHAPGHAKHHMFVIDGETGALWSGDGLGLYLPDVRVLRPGTPPPDFDLDQAVASVRAAAGRAPPAILFSHFGPVRDVEQICDLAIERMREWASIVQQTMRDTEDVGEVARRLRDRTASEMEGAENRASAEDRYDALTTYEVNAAGLLRYFQKAREDAHRPVTSGPDPG
jgi:glyoxylase-like metal-dependent hydrolase (beta-lactamase superfamily II)